MERRAKRRFAIERDICYKILVGKHALQSGRGRTRDISSSGVAFRAEHAAEAGSFVELSISWPVPLENGCPLRLVAFGRIVRSGSGDNLVSTLETYEFRTEAPANVISGTISLTRRGDKLRQWAQLARREARKTRLALVSGQP